MVLTIGKKKEVATLEETVELELPERVENYLTLKAELASKLKELEPLTRLVKSLGAHLQEIADEFFLADAEGVLVGVDNNISYGKKANAVQSINREELIKALTQDTFMEIANVGIGDMRKYCNPKQLEKILTEERTGNRKEKAQPIV